MQRKQFHCTLECDAKAELATVTGLARGLCGSELSTSEGAGTGALAGGPGQWALRQVFAPNRSQAATHIQQKKKNCTHLVM